MGLHVVLVLNVEAQCLENLMDSVCMCMYLCSMSMQDALVFSYVSLCVGMM